MTSVALRLTPAPQCTSTRCFDWRAASIHAKLALKCGRMFSLSTSASVMGSCLTPLATSRFSGVLWMVTTDLTFSSFSSSLFSACSQVPRNMNPGKISDG